MGKTFKTILYILLVLLVGIGIFYFFNKEKLTNTQPINNEEISETEEGTDEISTYIDVSPLEAKTLIEDTPNLVILDVSSAYADGHIPGAINYYVGDGSLDEAIPTLDMDVPYLVYCHVDSASISGAQKLIDAGFTEVYRLVGNYSAWVDAGYDIEM